MTTFMELWKSRQSVDGPTLLPIIREFALGAVGATLKLIGANETSVAEVTRRGLERLKSKPEESPMVSVREMGLKVSMKAFQGNFGEFERIMIFPKAGRWRASLRIELHSDGQGRYSIGNVFVGVLYWQSGSPPSRESLAVYARLQRTWYPLGVNPYRLPEESGKFYGFRLGQHKWDGTARDLQDRLGSLLAAAVGILPEFQEGQGGEVQEGDEEPMPTAKELSAEFARRGYRFTEEQVATFYGALKAKGFVILSGLSGTGKTKLAQEFAELLGHGSDQVLLESVRPDWRDSTGLLGYWNPVAQSYEAPPFLRTLLAARENYGQASANPYFIILDEMNLARVEYYLADVLSVMESGRGEDGLTRAEIHLHSQPDSIVLDDGTVVPRALRLPPNLYLIGTVNIDETTFAFSPKVLDRAFTIEFKEVNLSGYPPEVVEKDESTVDVAALVRDFSREGRFARVDKADVRKWAEARKPFLKQLEGLNEALGDYDLGFGYRVVDEILAFMTGISESKLAEELSDADLFDAAVMMKVLPKFHGPRHRIEEPLKAVLAWAGPSDQPASPRTWKKAERMRKKAEIMGFTSFA